MKPLKLTMQAFGPFAHCETLDFSSIDHGIFLVTGATGSGKTTIFDAIKYALYGVTSNEIRTAREMRCSQASSEDATYVQFEFEHSGNEYRVYRAPAQSRPKKRGSGMREVPSEASLEDVTNGLSLASKETEVSGRIIDMLGIDSMQFSRICMIAQNDFASVLNAKTKEREALFRKIFGTGIYSRVEELLEQRRDAIFSNMRELRVRANMEISRVSRPEKDELSALYDEICNLEDPSIRISDCIDLLEEVRSAAETDIMQCEAAQNGIKAQIGEIDGVLGREEVVEKARASKNKALEWLEANKQAIIDAKSRYLEQRSLDSERDSLRSRVSSIRSLLPRYEDLDKDLEELEDTKARQEEVTNGLVRQQKGLSDASSRRDALEHQREQIGDVELRKTRIEAESRQMEMQYMQLIQLRELVAKAERSQGNLKRDQEKLFSAEEAFQVANSSFVDAQRLYNADRAGMLADSLSEGKACPVCGSTEHPRLAKRAQGAPTEDELKKLEIECDNARDKRDRASQEAVASRAISEEMRKRADAQALDMLGVCGDKLEGALNGRIDEIRGKQTKIAQEKKTCDADAAQLRKLGKSLEKLNEQIAHAQREIESMREQQARLDIERAQLETSCAEKRASLVYPSKTSAEKEIAALEEKLESMQAAFEEARKRLTDLESEKTRCEADISSTDAALSGAEHVDASALREKRGELVKKEAAIASHITELQLSLSNAKAAHASLERLSKQISDAEQDFSSVDVIARLATGKMAGNMGRLAFETYVQATYFDKVLRAANERLRVMSSSRYSLLRRELGGDKRSVVGLEIDVYDRYTDKLRPASTLSGGETFLASLSLALGLSDVIMQEAGGIHLDAMFVDEGFGSLDDETCQLAIEVLSSLSSDNRMIGIISHVSELKERISRQVRVSMSPHGSSLDLHL